MKGFKKDGKFRPTGNKTKSSLKKSDMKKVSSPSGSGHEMREKKSTDTNNVTCPNCIGTGELEKCFYCGSTDAGIGNCAYCKWTEGDELPDGKDVVQCDEENLCCLCIGHGNKAGEIGYYDIPQEDEHLLPHTKEYFKDGVYPKDEED